MLQSGQPGELWGTAAPSAKVAVQIGSGGTPLAATASATGRFSVTLPARPASMAPVQITITAGGESLVLSDVLFGSVYVCSGQVRLKNSSRVVRAHCAWLAQLDRRKEV